MVETHIKSDELFCAGCDWPVSLSIINRQFPLLLLAARLPPTMALLSHTNTKLQKIDTKTQKQCPGQCKYKYRYKFTTNTDTNTDINTDINTDSNTDTNTYTNTDKNTDTNTDANKDTNTDTNTIMKMLVQQEIQITIFSTRHCYRSIVPLTNKSGYNIYARQIQMQI